jgi:hypothetical protein
MSIFGAFVCSKLPKFCRKNQQYRTVQKDGAGFIIDA